MQVSSYSNKKGVLSKFVHSPSEQKDKVNQILEDLRDLHMITPENFENLYKEVEGSIERTQGPTPIARLWNLKPWKQMYKQINTS